MVKKVAILFLPLFFTICWMIPGKGQESSGEKTTLAAPDVQDNIETYYTPFDNGAGERAVLNLIEKAQKEIKGNAYGLTDPEFANALIAARKRGVVVIFTIDSTQAAGPHQKPLLAQLTRAGVEIHTGKSPVHDQLLHLKGFEVDQKYIEDGSWNFSPSASMQYNCINIYKSPGRVKLFMSSWVQILDHVSHGE